MKRTLAGLALAAILLIVGVLAAPAMADARQLNPQDRTDAVRFARSYWADRGRYASDEGCFRVRTKIGFVNPDGDRHGWLGYWAPWDHCRLVLNGNEDWSDGDSRDPWWDLCSTVIHEYGHLVGRGHSRNPNSVMAGSMQLNHLAWWWPYFPDCRYDGDDEDGDDWPDW